MKFRTEIKCNIASNQIDHNSKIVLLGSCFSDHMVDKFEHFKFEHFSNPFGILFNPIAIQKALEECISKRYYSENDLIQQGDIWLSLSHHSKFNHRSKESALSLINENIKNGHSFLKSASHVIITLGTAWIYEWKENGIPVGNCHKISQKKFSKRLLGAEEVSKSLRAMVKKIRTVNKEAVIVFTLSPVRHLRDGFTENALSKSILLTSIHNVLGIDSATFYFPAFEIMMDDLRDYRFYKEDMVHPNKSAIDYIWEKFIHAWISKDSISLMNDIDDIQKSLAHRPFDPSSEGHQKFLKNLAQKIRSFEKKNPEIKFQ